MLWGMMCRATCLMLFATLLGCGVDGQEYGLCRAALEGRVAVSLELEVRYQDVDRSAGEGYELVERPVAWAAWEVVGQDGELLASGWLDVDGRSLAEFQVSPGASFYPRVMARMVRRGGVDVAVRSEALEIYAARGPVMEGATALKWRPVISSKNIGGAFNALDVIGRTLTKLAAWFGPPPEVRVVWEPGLKQNCGSCYIPMVNILLMGGGRKDPDQYDDSVLLHELGHYFEDNYAWSTSPGGAHHGEPVVPDLAWSEGFASFFGQAFLGTPLYVDHYSDGAFIMNLETQEAEEDWGTEEGALDGLLSEDLVSAVLWDLMDAEPEHHDHLTTDLYQVLSPAASWFNPDFEGPVGWPGIDLADYMTAWFASGNGHLPEVAEIVRHREYPYPFRAGFWLSWLDP